MVKTHSIPFDSTRIPIDGSIKMRFDRLSGFEEHYAANISMGGMFIKTNDIYSVGTVFDFDFELDGGQHLIQGRAEVIWRRVEDRRPDQPSGIGVRFLTLDLDSKYIIYRLVDRYIQLGGTPFNLESPDRAGKVMPPFSQIHLKRSLRFAGITVAVVATCGLLVASLRPRPAANSPITAHNESRTLPEPSTASEAPEAAPTEQTTASADSRPPHAGTDSNNEPIAGLSPADEQAAALEAMIHDWARAWSEKDVVRYLGFYSGDFQPPPGLSVASWKDQRRDRLSRPGPIQVVPSRLEVELVGPQLASARFDQAYTSATYQDRVKKKVELRLQEGEWKILREDVVASP